jgi:predicted DNA-binding protein
MTMENTATSVRITGDAIGVLSKLAEKLGESKAQVIERALKEMEERLFWAEVRDAFDRIASDPSEQKLQRSEIDLWEQGTSRDFQAEKW